MSQPRISIITPSFQQARYLSECLASVRDQGYAATEHIVVDGGSTDGSHRIIADATKDLAWWCSEKDMGQSHAINKGLAHATGTVLGWLNSDDTLLPGALEHIGSAFEQDPELLIYEGVRMVRHVDGEVEAQPLNQALDTEALFISPYINQQSTFFNMEAVRSVGGVDGALRYVMDYELWLQLLFRYGTTNLRTDPVPLAMFRVHAESKTAIAQADFVDEMAGVLHGLCRSTGLADLANVLELGHMLPAGLRGIPVDARERDRVERMTVHFLLHWNRVVFSERRFKALRMFLATPHANASWFTTAQRDRVAAIAEQVRVPGWWAFRMKRKWQHLWP